MSSISATQILIDSAITLSKEEGTEDFDLQAGQTWIYPTNYPLRDYQFSITQEALLKNTLVSLPTGLGKTFIAAVVMFNFYRWYPRGKVIFMAPTKPLVKQQIDACYNIMAIPKDVTVELTGSKVQTARRDLWKEKRVFFITPQVLQNDLDILEELGKKIKCIVFDEAHRAKGNYAYCQVIRKLRVENNFFRVLALSATPGNNLNDVLEVVNNLMISHIELRTDTSPDVKPYVFERSLETIVVPLGDQLLQTKQDYIQILDKHTRFLMHHNVIHGNCSTLTKGKIFMTLKEFQERSKTGRDHAHGEILRNLNICVTLYHAYELLIRHGLRGFLSFFQEHLEKPLLRGNVMLQKIVSNVAQYLGPTPNIEKLPDGTIPDVPADTKFGHPKFYKLGEILSSHFETSEEETRVIVFCEYRESVMEAYAHLLQLRPRVKPMIFLGQGSITQKKQISVVQAFRKGEYNTLISTCIGEEGLDVGDIDLIVCFDINNKSPVRMVQRMGRTGRKRRGRVIILVTEGKEQQILQDCLAQKNNLNNFVSKSADLQHGMYANSPRMVPKSIQPKCQKIFITVVKPGVKLTKKKSNIMDLFNNMTCTQKTAVTYIENSSDRIPQRKELWDKSVRYIKELDSKETVDLKQISKLRSLQSVGFIGHSKDSEDLVNLLGMGEAKRFNLSFSQIPEISSTKSRKITKTNSSSSLKQTDIRSLFANSRQKKSDTVLDIPDVIELSDEETYLDFDNLLLSNSNCVICDHLFDCKRFRPKTFDRITFQLRVPNICVDNITEELLDKFNETLKVDSMENCVEMETREAMEFDKSIQEVVDDDFFTKFLGLEEDEFERAFIEEKSPIIQKSFDFDKVSENCKSQNNQIDETKESQGDNDLDRAFQQSPDLFDDSVNSKFETCTNFHQILNKCGLSSPNKLSDDLTNQTLNFFHLNNLEDLFSAPEPRTPKTTPENEERETSPILCSFERSLELKSKMRRKLFESQVDDSLDLLNSSVSVSKPNLSILNAETQLWKKKDSPKKEETIAKIDLLDDSFFDFTFEIPKLLKTPTRTPSPVLSNSKKRNESTISCTSNSLLSVTQIIDLVNSPKKPEIKKRSPLCMKKSANENDDVDLDDSFNFLPSFKTQKTKSTNCERISTKLSLIAENSQKENDLNVRNILEQSSDDDFEMPQNHYKETNSKKKKINLGRKKKTKKREGGAGFIDLEAEVSSDGQVISDDEFEGSDDQLDSSFVDDDTQAMGNCTMQQVQYLKSVKSPTLQRGKFKIPLNNHRNHINVFSQPVRDDSENVYVNDSFCVNEDIEPSQNMELSELEVAEMILERKRQNRKKVRKKCDEEPSCKRRRIIVISSDSE